jgi:TPR repeat protein
LGVHHQDLTEEVEVGALQLAGPVGERDAAGVGGERDLVEAQAWYALGAAQGDSEAGQRAEAVMKELTPENREKARARLKTLPAATSDTPAP